MRDLTGKRFGRLVAVKRFGVNKWGNITWECSCDCGKSHVAASGKLVSGKVSSCGCYANELHISQLEKHGITTGGKPRTFIIWNGMKARCLNDKSVSYPSYGGRGVKICIEWMSFENFHKWAVTNGYQEDLTIDRIDNDGNYEPDNCRWVSKYENKKHKRNTRYFTVCGVTKNVSDWCRYLNVSRATAYKHINTGKGQLYFVNKFIEERDRKQAA